MPQYIVLMKFTPLGREHLKEMPAGLQQMQASPPEGMRVLGGWWTMGQYDAVSVFEGPDDNTVAAELLKHGWFTTETLRAFTIEEMTEMVATLPD